MFRQRQHAVLLLGVGLLVLAASAAVGPTLDIRWLWVDPVDMESRDLYWGLGSPERAPKATEYTFLEEDLDGVNPKYEVRDSNGVKWKVKIGLEAQPEIAATRLVWAAGYHTHEDYFVPSLRISNLPENVERGKKWIGPGGVLTNARLRRHREKEKKVGFWNWDENPYLGQREFNGLRTLMAVLNNWDLKDTNTSIVDNWQAEPGRPNRMYMSSDVGSSFGSTKIQWSQENIKGNLEKYDRSEFITKSTPEGVSFSVPGDFRLNGTFVQYLFRRPRQWITREIPRQDVKWLGDLLGRLSPSQIRDAFRAAGYDTADADGFARVVERRIAELRAL